MSISIYLKQKLRYKEMPKQFFFTHWMKIPVIFWTTSEWTSLTWSFMTEIKLCRKKSQSNNKGSVGWLQISWKKKIHLIRKHSSRMRTVRFCGSGERAGYPTYLPNTLHTGYPNPLDTLHPRIHYPPTKRGMVPEISYPPRVNRQTSVKSLPSCNQCCLR